MDARFTETPGRRWGGGVGTGLPGPGRPAPCSPGRVRSGGSSPRGFFRPETGAETLRLSASCPRGWGSRGISKGGSLWEVWGDSNGGGRLQCVEVRPSPLTLQTHHLPQSPLKNLTGPLPLPYQHSTGPLPTRQTPRDPLSGKHRESQPLPACQESQGPSLVPAAQPALPASQGGLTPPPRSGMACSCGPCASGRSPAAPTMLPWPPWGAPTRLPHARAHLHGVALAIQAVLSLLAVRPPVEVPAVGQGSKQQRAGTRNLQVALRASVHCESH